MKKGMLFFLSVLLLAALVFALSSCRDKTPPETTVGEYEITFIVGDSSLTVSVASGETPVYPNGTPKKGATATEGYRFTGWNAELAPASADATYTAKFFSVPIEEVPENPLGEAWATGATIKRVGVPAALIVAVLVTGIVLLVVVIAKQIRKRKAKKSKRHR